MEVHIVNLCNCCWLISITNGRSFTLKLLRIYQNSAFIQASNEENLLVKPMLLVKLEASARRNAVKQQKRALKLELKGVMAQVARRGVTVVLLLRFI
jgi:hypothetical protein